VRGIGSLYYLGYAATHVELIDEGALWALVAFTIFASTVSHGLTANATVEVLDREYAEGGSTERGPGAEIPTGRSGPEQSFPNNSAMERCRKGALETAACRSGIHSAFR
jgi:hypothetical protein